MNTHHILALFIIGLTIALGACAPVTDKTTDDTTNPDNDADSADAADSIIEDEPDSQTNTSPDTTIDNTPPADTATQTQVIDIAIRGFRFEPAVITAGIGDTLRFTNFDNAPHTATTLDGTNSFDSGTMREDDMFEYLVDATGTTRGHCTFHPGMTFTLNVE